MSATRTRGCAAAACTHGTFDALIRKNAHVAWSSSSAGSSLGRSRWPSTLSGFSRVSGAPAWLAPTTTAHHALTYLPPSRHSDATVAPADVRHVPMRALRMTSSSTPGDVGATPDWWEAATEGARSATGSLQNAVTLALRGRSPRLVEIVMVGRKPGLAAVTSDTLIVAVDDETETRTLEVPVDQLTALIQKSPRDISIGFASSAVELRVASEDLIVAIWALRVPASPHAASTPERTRHAVSPPSRPLAAPHRVSEPGDRLDRRAQMPARRSEVPVGMGSRRARTAPVTRTRPDPPSPDHRRAPPAPPASPVPAPSWTYSLGDDGVWRRPAAAPVAARSAETDDEHAG
jgi:hypothetical protein